MRFMLRRRCPSLKVRGVRRRSFILTVTVSFDSDCILLVDADDPPLMEVSRQSRPRDIKSGLGNFMAEVLQARALGGTLSK